MFEKFASTKIVFCIAIASVLLLLWQHKVSINVYRELKVGHVFYLSADFLRKT